MVPCSWNLKGQIAEGGFFLIIQLKEPDLAALQEAEANLIKARQAFAEAQESLRKKMVLAVAKGGGKIRTPQGQPIGWELLSDEGCLVSND